MKQWMMTENIEGMQINGNEKEKYFLKKLKYKQEEEKKKNWKKKRNGNSNVWCTSGLEMCFLNVHKAYCVIEKVTMSWAFIHDNQKMKGINDRNSYQAMKMLNNEIKTIEKKI